ncbi:hypothetical protein K7X08_030546 [Anisodus acutangulus]|uniref:Uncharacterized protein n=1 Tax=Anisodus acutangulus TaxID=402998 RepID=A0A9Q1MQU5_9SOLA|nr:hypothetical protein K7X08_030546 [Anisodus acutangulus]
MKVLGLIHYKRVGKKSYKLVNSASLARGCSSTKLLRYIFSLKIYRCEDLCLEEMKASPTLITRQVIYCPSLSWSADGSTIFSGYTNGLIRVQGIGRY